MEDEPKEVITEDGKESALRSASLLRLDDPDLADCLAQFAMHYDGLIEENEGMFAVITADEISDQLFETEMSGMQFASIKYDNRRVIVHRISRIGIPGNSTYIANFEDDLFTILDARSKSKLNPYVTGTTFTQIERMMKLEQVLGNRQAPGSPAKKEGNPRRVN